MNDEIKEKMTIGKAKKILRGFLAKDCYYDTPLYYAIPYLLDYITNLQQENEKLLSENITIKSVRNMVDETIYKSRCEKAVEYIKKHIEKCNIDGYEGKFDNFDIFTKPQKLLNILNGDKSE